MQMLFISGFFGQLQTRLEVKFIVFFALFSKAGEFWLHGTLFISIKKAVMDR